MLRAPFDNLLLWIQTIFLRDELNTDDSSDKDDEDEEDTDTKDDDVKEEEDSEDDFAYLAEDDLPELASMSKEEREELDQNEFFLKRMLKRNAEQIFTAKDLHNEDILNRGIDLLHHKRQGRQQVTEVLGVHIRYFERLVVSKVLYNKGIQRSRKGSNVEEKRTTRLLPMRCNRLEDMSIPCASKRLCHGRWAFPWTDSSRIDDPSAENVHRPVGSIPG